MNTAIATVDNGELDRQINPFVSEAKALTVTTPTLFGLASSKVGVLKDLRKQVDDAFDPGIALAHQAHKAAVSLNRKFTDRLDEAEKIIKAKLLSYKVGQDRLLAIEQARIDDINRKAMAKAESQAQTQEKKGNPETAQAIRKTAPFIPAAVSQVPNTGFSYREVITAKITDPDLVPEPYRMPDQDALDKIPGFYPKDKLPVIPGVEWVTTKIAVQRR